MCVCMETGMLVRRTVIPALDKKHTPSRRRVSVCLLPSAWPVCVFRAVCVCVCGVSFLQVQLFSFSLRLSLFLCSFPAACVHPTRVDKCRQRRPSLSSLVSPRAGIWCVRRPLLSCRCTRSTDWKREKRRTHSCNSTTDSHSSRAGKPDVPSTRFCSFLRASLSPHSHTCCLLQHPLERQLDEPYLLLSLPLFSPDRRRGPGNRIHGNHEDDREIRVSVRLFPLFDLFSRSLFPLSLCLAMDRASLAAIDVHCVSMPALSPCSCSVREFSE